MKGLIYKDLITLKSTMVAMLVLAMVYIFIGVVGDNAVLYLTMMVAINTMLPLSLAATDEQCGWDSFGVALPVSRTKTVVARYITSIVVMLASELLVAAAQVISMIKGGTPMNFSQYMVITIFCLLLSALIIPIIYKFGVQKGRIIMMTICLVPSMLTVFLIVLMFRLSDEAFDNTIDTVTTTLEQTPVTAIILVAFIITVVLYALSMLLSISIYKKKDF